MLLKILAVGAIILFFVGIVAVLQGWSKVTMTDHLVSIGFITIFGAGATWGARVLGPWH